MENLPAGEPAQLKVGGEGACQATCRPDSPLQALTPKAAVGAAGAWGEVEAWAEAGAGAPARVPPSRRRLWNESSNPSIAMGRRLHVVECSDVDE